MVGSITYVSMEYKVECGRLFELNTLDKMGNFITIDVMIS